MKYDTKALEAKMKKTISAYETNLETIRAGQANPAVLNRVTFEYYGAPTPLNTMANVMVTDARTLTIQPYDRSTLKAMEKAILASDVGITPLNDGTVLRLVFPQLTEERRRDLTQQVKKMGPLKGILSKLPGINSSKLDEMDIDDRIMDRNAAIILSMTPEERAKPELLQASRKRRIAAGSGVKVEDINRLLKQFDMMNQMVKQFSGPGASKKMKRMGKFGGMGGFPGGFPGM